MVWVTSDLHLCHDKDFIWAPRGFKSVWEMNDTIIENWNKVVAPDDEVYVLGDLMLKDLETGRKLLSQLKGNIHVVLGNHDTDTRIDIYNHLHNVVSVSYAERIKYKKFTFFMCHYPMYVGNYSGKSMWCLSGHTHSKEIFQKEFPQNYNVALDAHYNNLVSLDKVIEDINEFIWKTLFE